MRFDLTREKLCFFRSQALQVTLIILGVYTCYCIFTPVVYLPYLVIV